MKTIISIFSSIILFITSCGNKQENSCPPPLGVEFNDIDWNTYNSVDTTYINNNLECSDSKTYVRKGKTIKICGWKIQNNDNFSITDDSLYAIGEHSYHHSFPMNINYPSEIQEKLSILINNSDLSKKCYIVGKLYFEKIMDGDGDWCCQVAPYIFLENIEDIYFEK
jgi:hypothetical protein